MKLTREQQAENRALERAARKVLHATRIPPNAEHPTRDIKVILGEDHARLIRSLKHQG